MSDKHIYFNLSLILYSWLSWNLFTSSNVSQVSKSFKPTHSMYEHKTCFILIFLVWSPQRKPKSCMLLGVDDQLNSNHTFLPEWPIINVYPQVLYFPKWLHKTQRSKIWKYHALVILEITTPFQCFGELLVVALEIGLELTFYLSFIFFLLKYGL